MYVLCIWVDNRSVGGEATADVPRWREERDGTRYRRCWGGPGVDLLRVGLEEHRSLRQTWQQTQVNDPWYYGLFRCFFSFIVSFFLTLTHMDSAIISSFQQIYFRNIPTPFSLVIIFGKRLVLVYNPAKIIRIMIQTWNATNRDIYRTE